jgi:hypothetical protein
MSFQGPPRGSGRHWRDDTPPAGVPRRPYVEPHPSDTQMSPPMNYQPDPAVGQERRRIIIERDDRPRYQDMIVPRVSLESDPAMEDLRRSTYRWVRAAAATVVFVGLYLLGTWTLPPLWSLLGG